MKRMLFLFAMAASGLAALGAGTVVVQHKFSKGFATVNNFSPETVGGYLQKSIHQFLSNPGYADWLDRVKVGGSSGKKTSDYMGATMVMYRILLANGKISSYDPTWEHSTDISLAVVNELKKYGLKLTDFDWTGLQSHVDNCSLDTLERDDGSVCGFGYRLGATDHPGYFFDAGLPMNDPEKVKKAGEAAGQTGFTYNFG